MPARTGSGRAGPRVACRGSRGFALLLVLLLSAISMVVVTELVFQADYELLAARNVSDLMQIEYAIDGQFEVVLSALRFDKRQDEALDTEFDEWNAQRIRERTEGAVSNGPGGAASGGGGVALTTRVFDERGKFWLGSLVTGPEPRRTRAKEVFVRLLDLFRDGISTEKSKGGDLDIADAEDIAARVIRYLTREGAQGQVPKPSSTGSGGSENVPLLLDELLFVDTKDNRLLESLLYDQQTKDAVAPGLHRFLTVYGDGKINLNTAPRIVLAAQFSQGTDRDIAQRIIDRRQQAAEGGTGASGGSSGGAAGAANPKATAGGNPFTAVTELVDGSVEGLTQEVLTRNGIDPAVDFDVRSDVFTVRIEGATERTQRIELYAVERVKREDGDWGFRFLLHQERTDRLLETSEDAIPGAAAE